MEQSKIDRINFLARKAKNEGLTNEEAKEQKELREEYIALFRASMRAQLESTYIKHPDGRIEKVKRKDK